MGQKISEEKLGEISPNLLKTIILDVQEIQPSPGKINTKKMTPGRT